MEPIRCYECGQPISSIWDAFTYMRKLWLEASLKADNNNLDEDKQYLDPDLNQNLTLIFEALNIERYCTREHLTTIKHIHNF